MKEIKIVEVKEIKKDDKKFNAFKTVTKSGDRMDVKFCKDCTNVPKEPCVIKVKEENANVDKRKQYPVLWIKEVEEIIPIVRESNLDEYFD